MWVKQSPLPGAVPNRKGSSQSSPHEEILLLSLPQPFSCVTPWLGIWHPYGRLGLGMMLETLAPCLMAPQVPAATPHAECKHTFPKLHDCASGLNGKINMQCRTVSVEEREDPETVMGQWGFMAEKGQRTAPLTFSMS